VHARIEHHADDVRDQVADHDREGDHEEHAHDHRQVEPRGCVVEHLPDAG
jgi:hypothetical protein